MSITTSGGSTVTINGNTFYQFLYGADGFITFSSTTTTSILMVAGGGGGGGGIGASYESGGGGGAGGVADGSFTFIGGKQYTIRVGGGGNGGTGGNDPVYPTPGSSGQNTTILDGATTVASVNGGGRGGSSNGSSNSQSGGSGGGGSGWGGGFGSVLPGTGTGLTQRGRAGGAGSTCGGGGGGATAVGGNGQNFNGNTNVSGGAGFTWSLTNDTYGGGGGPGTAGSTFNATGGTGGPGGSGGGGRGAGRSVQAVAGTNGKGGGGGGGGGSSGFTNGARGGDGIVLIYNPTSLGTAPTINSITFSSNKFNVFFTPGTGGTPAPTTYFYSLDNGVTYTNANSTTSPIVISGIVAGVIYNVALIANNLAGNTAPSNIVTASISYPCFLQGSKILRFNSEIYQDEYIPVEKLRKDDLILTSESGYKAIHSIGYRPLFSPKDDPNPSNRLYKFTRRTCHAIFEPLYITGEHCTLHSRISDEKLAEIKTHMGDVYITEEFYRMPAFMDDRAEPYDREDTPVTIWHFALENDNVAHNYGVYANGLLVESCAIESLMEKSGMNFLE